MGVEAEAFYISLEVMTRVRSVLMLTNRSTAGPDAMRSPISTRSVQRHNRNTILSFSKLVF